ncbi:MAG: RNA methyltransferase [Thermacetogeniaceae bacterium]|nr:RNA methyltransferase [Syntrophomonadaceae bacterium]
MEIKTMKQALKFARCLKKRKYRELYHNFLIEGVNFVEDALFNNAPLDYVMVAEDNRYSQKCKEIMEQARLQQLPLFFVKDELLAKISDTETPQGVVAVCSMPVWNEEQVIREGDGLLVALDGLQDPGNLGTIIRTAAGVGVKAVFLGKGTVDLFNPKVLRATMGAVFRVPVFQQVELDTLIRKVKEAGFLTVAADPRTDKKYYHVDFRKGGHLILIGNESRGIRTELLDLVDLKVRIPLAGGVESLNAAVAASLILYEIFRQRDPG